METILLALLLSTSLCIVSSELSAYLYQAKNCNVPNAEDFPETNILKGKPSTAIAFSGGGARAFLCAIGQLSALNSLGLIRNIKYVGGISGGSWATTSFTFNQNNNDEVFLGSIVPPSEITRDDLNQMEDNCARSFASADLTKMALDAWHSGLSDSFSSGWAYAVQKAYLEPAAIPYNTRYSWSEDTVNDIISRNPVLAKERFVLPANSDRPFPIIGATIVGPVDAAPYSDKTLNFTRIEFTPIYIGEFRSLDVSYTYDSDGSSHVSRVGGAIETFAFPRKGSPPVQGLDVGETIALKYVPTPDAFYDLAFTAGASSYSPGSFANSANMPSISDLFGLSSDYFSPSDSAPVKKEWFLSDGGCYENLPLMSYLQRRVENIVLFFNDITTLQPFDQWNVTTDAPNEDQVVDVLSAYFGVLPPTNRVYNRTYDYSHNQVFTREDYNTVIMALQAAQQEGRGIITTQRLSTVANDWWGIPAGITSNITFVYLSRLSGWENELSEDMKPFFIPHQNADDLGKNIGYGPFKDFPNYATTGGLINYERANALADMTGWAVLQHADEFKKIMSAT